MQIASEENKMKNKKIFLLTSLFLCSSCSIVNLFTPKAQILKEPSKFRNVIKSVNFDELSQNVRDFSANFSVETFKALDSKNDNFVVSPLSMYSALAVASACSDGNTKKELLDVLKTSDDLLKSEFANLYAASNRLRTYSSDSKIVKKEELTNSLWIDKNVSFKSETLDMLAEKFYSYSVTVDYQHSAKKANRQMSKFVEEKTNGLLSPKFNFDADTVLTILNTLYLKSLWNASSDFIQVSDESYEFLNRNGSVSSEKFLLTSYQEGRVLKREKYSSFFAETADGDRVKFIVPNDGVSLEEVVTPDIISEINNLKYEGFDEENNVMYYTRTHFPAFEAEGDIKAKSILKTMGINDFFIDGACDFSPLTDTHVYCDEVMHEAKLKVDKKGIEGAAYTAIIMKNESAPFDEYEKVYEEFIVDKAFYYVVSDHNNLPVFSGIVN